MESKKKQKSKFLILINPRVNLNSNPLQWFSTGLAPHVAWISFLGRGGPGWVIGGISSDPRSPPLCSDGLQTGPNAFDGSRLAPCLLGSGDSNLTLPRHFSVRHLRSWLPSCGNEKTKAPFLSRLTRRARENRKIFSPLTIAVSMTCKLISNPFVASWERGRDRTKQGCG